MPANTLYHFLDLEAGVGGDDSEEEDEELDDDFITNSEHTDRDRNDVIPPRLVGKSTGNDKRVDDWSDFVAGLEDRYDTLLANVPKSSEGSNESERLSHSEQSRTPHAHPTIHSDLYNIIAPLSRNEYPFWRVRCKPKLQDNVSSDIRHLAREKHQIRSIAAPRSVQNSVYLEASMNIHLRELLQTIPGIIHDPGLIIEEVPVDEMKDLRDMSISTMPPPPKVETWVRVRRGTYKGDVGFVVGVPNGNVQLLLIPRLSQPLREYETGDVHNLRSAPCLFDSFHVQQQHDEVPERIGEGIFKFRGNLFEHGLVKKRFVSSFVSVPVSCMPLDMFKLFRACCHPKIAESSYPRPLEWEFVEDPPFKSGLISELGPEGVKLVFREGLVTAKWMNVRKVIRQRDYVEITGGEYNRQQGWVAYYCQTSIFNHDKDGTTMVCDDLANVICRKPNGTVETIELVHVNLLIHADVPHVLGVQPKQESDLVAMREKAPWINTEVVVIGRHHLRLQHGIVKDVIHGQKTKSGLMVIIQPTMAMTTGPWTNTLDYDLVVEAKSYTKLHQFAPTTSTIFQPHNSKPITANQIPVLKPPPAHEIEMQSLSPGYLTPFPDQPSDSTSPAWNPLSTINDIVDHHLAKNPGTEPSSILPEPTVADHVFFDRRLLDIPLRALISGKRRDIVVKIGTADDPEQFIIQRQAYNKWETLPPASIHLKYPNPTRDNGLLVVIKGDHCGKYVRRIHHRYEGEQAIIKLLVVRRVSGHQDLITGDCIELDASYLCACRESNEDKVRNASLMMSLREEARLTRAK